MGYDAKRGGERRAHQPPLGGAIRKALAEPVPSAGRSTRSRRPPQQDHLPSPRARRTATRSVQGRDEQRETFQIPLSGKSRAALPPRAAPLAKIGATTLRRELRHADRARRSPPRGRDEAAISRPRRDSAAEVEEQRDRTPAPAGAPGRGELSRSFHSRRSVRRTPEEPSAPAWSRMPTPPP